MIINLFGVQLKDFTSGHTIYTLSTQYLHIIYTLSTPQVTGPATTARAPASALLASRGRSAPTPAPQVTSEGALQIANVQINTNAMGFLMICYQMVDPLL